MAENRCLAGVQNINKTSRLHIAPRIKMSGQSRVSDFFSKTKKYDGVQPSKRQKIVVSPLQSPSVGARTRARISKVVQPSISLNAHNIKRKSKRTCRAKTDIVIKPTKQKTLSDLIGGEKLNDHNPSNESFDIEAVPTSVCDNHNGSPPCSPTKRHSNTVFGKEEIIQISTKRSRVKNVAFKNLFQDEPKAAFNFENKSFSKDREVISPRRRSSEEKHVVFQFGAKEKEQVAEEKIQKLVEKICSPITKSKPAREETCSATIPKEIFLEPNASEIVPQPEEIITPTVEKIKAKMKKDPTILKKKLAKCTNLTDLKEQLRMLKEAKQESPKKMEKVDLPAIDTTKETSSSIQKPAYMRFATLTEPIPPGLTLPKHLKLLLDMFISVDTVVSILHKRHEICTFSKLSAAVQHMTRKNFELKNLGQIKTVYPSAYSFKQERNLPCYGKKNSNEYQLTVEANLVDDPLSQNCHVQMLNKDGRPDFTAVRMMERKSIFHRQLIELIRSHHKTFLLNLERPISVPDDKITKWHPKFPIEEVPDIEIADLPKAQIIHVITTAKEALEHAKGKFNHPRVIHALEKVAAKNEANDTKNKTPKKSQESPSSNTVVKTPENQALKGVSLSLLEKIRAKEMRKQVEAMFRSPAEEKKTERMARLPELVRIIRTLFVTSKKPALLEGEVIQKMQDSYKNSMGQAEAECHLKLMVEVIPDWVSIITLKRGVFVKINVNKDINTIIDSLNKQVKNMA